MARASGRRPGLAGQRRQRPRDPAAHLARRHHGRLDLHPRRRPRDPPRPRRRRFRHPSDALGESPYPGARLDRRRAGPRDLHLRPGQPPAQLGAHRPARRRPVHRPAVRPGRPCRLRPAHRAAVRADGTGSGLVEAVPGRYGGQAVDRPGGRRGVRTAARGAGREPGVPRVGRRPDRLPLRPRGHRRAVLLPGRRLRPAPAHPARRVLRPARVRRRHPRRLRLGR